MIKEVIKNIFPQLFLKRSFLLFNKIKIRTWDKIFFSEKFIPKESFLVKEEKNPFLENDINVSDFPIEAQKKLAPWVDPLWKQDQYFLYYREPGYLEPSVGWAVTGSKQLIYPSLGFSRAPHVPRPSWKETYLRKAKVVKLSKIISLRDTGEENYFHFYNDVIAKLFYIRDNNFDLKDFTIVVSIKLYKKEFFQYFIKNTWLNNLKFHVQSIEWISFEEAIFCKPFTHTKKYLEMARTLVQPKLSITKSRRIFLNRSRKTLRFIENMDEITPFLQDNQFEVIDSTNFSLSQQIQLFSECQFLVSIHGAGLTNMIYREGHPLSILEILHPFDYIPFHYVMMAKIYRYKYQLLLGEKGQLRRSGGFRVSQNQFKIALKSMLSSDTDHGRKAMTL